MIIIIVIVIVIQKFRYWCYFCKVLNFMYGKNDNRPYSFYYYVLFKYSAFSAIDTLILLVIHFFSVYSFYIIHENAFSEVQYLITEPLILKTIFKIKPHGLSCSSSFGLLAALSQNGQNLRIKTGTFHRWSRCSGVISFNVPGCCWARNM